MAIQDPKFGLDDVAVNTEPLNKEDVINLITTSLETNDALAREFADRVIPHLSHLIRENIDVDPVSIDGSVVGKYVTDALQSGIKEDIKKSQANLSKQLSNISLDGSIKSFNSIMAKSVNQASTTLSGDIQKYTNHISDKLTQSSKEFTAPQISVPDVETTKKNAPVEKVKATEPNKDIEKSVDNKKTQQTKFQPDVTSPMSVASIGDIFSGLKSSDSILTQMKYERFRRDLLDKLMRAFNPANLKLQDVKLADIFTPPSTALSAYIPFSKGSISQYEKLQREIIGKLTTAVKEGLTLDKELKLSDIFSPPKNGSLMRDLPFFGTAAQYEKLQRQIISSLNAIDFSDIALKNDLKLSDIFQPPTNSFWSYMPSGAANKFDDLQGKIIDTLRDQSEGIQLTDKKLKLSDVFQPPTDSFWSATPFTGSAAKFEKLQRSMLNKLQKQLDDVEEVEDEKETEDVNVVSKDETFENISSKKQERDKLGYTSLLEDRPTLVNIVSFSDEAEEELKDLFDSIDIKPEQEIKKKDDDFLGKLFPGLTGIMDKFLGAAAMVALAGYIGYEVGSAIRNWWGGEKRIQAGKATQEGIKALQESRKESIVSQGDDATDVYNIERRKLKGGKNQAFLTELLNQGFDISLNEMKDILSDENLSPEERKQYINEFNKRHKLAEFDPKKRELQLDASRAMDDILWKNTNEMLDKLKKQETTLDEIKKTATPEVGKQARTVAVDSARDIIDQGIEDYIGSERTYYAPLKKPAEDFIWRQGEPIQPFKPTDNIIATEDPKLFEKLLKEKGTESSDFKKDFMPIFDKQVKAFDEIKRSLLTLNETVASKKGRMVEEQQPYGQQPMTGVSNNAGDIRDPAYVLRGRVWDRLRDAYILI